MALDVELRIADVRPAVPAGPGVEAGLVVLQELEEPGRMLRILVGQYEARAIQAAWHGTFPARPSTWDLFVSALELCRGRLERVVITAVEDERHFFATLDLLHDHETRTLPCRPSDAVALALRTSGARILATEEVMEAAGVLADGSKPPPVVRPVTSADDESSISFS